MTRWERSRPDEHRRVRASRRGPQSLVELVDRMTAGELFNEPEPFEPFPALSTTVEAAQARERAAAKFVGESKSGRGR